MNKHDRRDELESRGRKADQAHAAEPSEPRRPAAHGNGFGGRGVCALPRAVVGLRHAPRTPRPRHRVDARRRHGRPRRDCPGARRQSARARARVLRSLRDAHGQGRCSALGRAPGACGSWAWVASQSRARCCSSSKNARSPSSSTASSTARLRGAAPRRAAGSPKISGSPSTSAAFTCARSRSGTSRRARSGQTTRRSSNSRKSPAVGAVAETKPAGAQSLSLQQPQTIGEH